LPGAVSPNPTAQQFVNKAGTPQPSGGAGPVLTDAARAAVTLARQPTGGVESRAETQLGGEVATRPPVKSSRAGPVVAALLGVLVLGGGAAAFMLRSGPAPSASAQAKADAPPVTPEPPPAASSAPVVAPPVPSSPPPVTVATSEVKLEVVTDPPGAKVLKNGFQVCDASPCQVNATVNEALELLAQKDAMTGKAKVLAQKDQTVTIKLAAPVKAAPAAPRMCEVMVGDLKVLRPCQ
jgi:hypothetical protein